MAPSISLALIVREDGRNLPEWVRQVQPLFDEICIVDTTTHSTACAIARGIQAKYSAFIWCEDNAAAKNEAVRLCSSDWLFLMESTEFAEPRLLESLRQITKGPRSVYHPATILVCTTCDDAPGFVPAQPSDLFAKEFPGWLPSESIRLFPNHPTARYTGRCCEDIVPSLTSAGFKPSNTPVITIIRYPAPPACLNLNPNTHTILSSDDEHAILSDARNAIDHHDWAAATQRLQHVLSAQPGNPRALQYWARMAARQGNADNAEAILKYTIELNPALPASWRELGTIYEQSKTWKEASLCFGQVAKLRPDAHDAHFHLSIALENLSQLAEAAASAQQAFSLCPAKHEYMRLFIHLMLRLERRAEARSTILDAINHGHPDPVLHNALGELYFYDHMHEESKHHFRTAGELGLAPAYNNLGVVHFQLHEFDLARAAFEACLANDPEHPGARNNLDKVLRHIHIN